MILLLISKGITKDHEGGGLRNFIVSQFWRPEVRNQGVLRDMLLLKLCENPFLPLQVLVASGNPWYSLPCSFLTPISAFIVMWRTPCVSQSFQACLIVSIPVVLDLQTTLFQYGLILTSYICNNPISKSGHILRYWGLGLQMCLFLGDTLQPLYPIATLIPNSNS